MSTLRRRISMAILSTLVVLTTGAALAWACTPQAYINLSSTSGGPGDTVTVTGRGFIDGPVEIYWNESGTAPLATARGPEFSIPVTIPQAASGVHYVTTAARTPDGQLVGSPSRAFEIQGAALTPTGPSGGAPNDSRPAPKGTGRPLGDTPSPERPGALQLTGASPPRDRTPARSQAPSASGGPALDSSAAVRTPSLDDVPGDSTPTSGRGQAVGGVSDSAPAPSAGSAVADLWSGFGSSRAPSLLSGEAADVPGADGGSPLAVGVGLMGLGLVALFAGFAMAEVRRRRRAPVDLDRPGG